MSYYKGNYPENKEEWWKLVDEFWYDLVKLMYQWIPMNGYEDIDRNILINPLALKIEELKKDRNRDLSRYFQATWSAAPDSRGLFEYKCWDLLCDLCSEDYVLYEDEQEKLELE